MPPDYERIAAKWDAAAENEEAWLARPSINRSLRWREIERNLSGVSSICDVGGGTGAFSVPLAQRGFQVTHVDVSAEMLRKTKAKIASLSNIQLFQGNAADLSRFADRSFDLLLNFDGPLASSGEDAGRVISESCRITKKTLILSTAHLAWTASQWLAESFASQGRLPSDLNLPSSAGKAFLPRSLASLIEENGLRVTRAGGIGSLATLWPQELLTKILAQEQLLNQFLNLCEQFDAEILSEGPGTRDDTGLLIVARRQEA
jgi:SAM-dependent methyltransferase